MMGFGGIGIIIIIAAAYFLYKYETDQNIRTRDNRESPLEILKKRFASGDISREEFEEKKKVLQ